MEMEKEETDFEIYKKVLYFYYKEYEIWQTVLLISIDEQYSE